MSAPRELICFGEDWGRHPSTAQFLMRQLLDSFRVIWINSLGWRAPRPTRADLARALAKLRVAARGPAQPATNLTVFTPLVLPWYSSAAVRRINAVLLERSVRALARRHGFTRYTLMTTYPAAADVFTRFPDVRRVYYCADQYTAFPGLDRALVQAMETRLLGEVDAVVTTSVALHEAKAALHPNVAYLPHGVDVEHFSRAADPATVIPDDLKTLPRPIIGLHGLIWDLIDTDIIDAIAYERPEWSIVLVGPQKLDASRLPRRHNIHYLGERPYAAIPAYLRGFDVCLMPYRLVPMLMYSNPIKLREYLAAGKPIVSTPVPEVAQFRELVQVAGTGKEFVSAIERCLWEKPALKLRRRERVAADTWACRATQLAEVL